MNCLHCWRPIDENAKFCTACGKPVSNPPESEPFVEPTDRNTSVAYFEKAKNLFSKFAPYFDEIINCTIQKDQIVRSGKHHPDRGFWIAGIIGIISSFVALAVHTDDPNRGEMLACYFGVSIALLITAIIMKTVVATKMDQKSEATVEQATNELNTRIDAAYDQIQHLYEQNDFLLHHYPQQYFSEQAISACLNYLYAGRADNRKEALNLYEQELHQIRLEEAQQNALTVQQSILDTALRTEAEARATKKAAVATAVMTGLQFRETRRISKRL